VDSKQKDLVARDAEPCHAGRRALSRMTPSLVAHDAEPCHAGRQVLSRRTPSLVTQDANLKNEESVLLWLLNVNESLARLEGP
jgi:hypothetical protein